ncbi:hypothetical protein F5X99DRAFT_71639 [Biscogniauxia marginata]|nr:hypothetical protein F5X99DRAFT_71639 [Biscogniauxia marginata]
MYRSNKVLISLVFPYLMPFVLMAMLLSDLQLYADPRLVDFGRTIRVVITPDSPVAEQTRANLNSELSSRCPVTMVSR